jgi:hypothetical protein
MHKWADEWPRACVARKNLAVTEPEQLLAYEAPDR